MSVALRSSFVQMYFERSMKIFFHYKLVFELNIILLHSLKGIIAYINIGRFWSSSLLNKIFEIIYHLVSSFHNYILFQI